MKRIRLSILFCLLLLMSLNSYAAEAYEAQTAADPAVSVADLELLVRPLRKEELVVESEAWFDLLRRKVEEISSAEIEMRTAGRDISQTKAEIEEEIERIQTARQEDQQPETGTAAEETVKAQGEAEVAQHAEAKEALVTRINLLRGEQIGLIDRFKSVIAALKKKGGEIEEFELYIAAVSGLRIDATDVSGTSALLMGWLRSPEGGLRWAWSILKALVILAVAMMLARVLGNVTRKALTLGKKIPDLLRDFFEGVVRKLILIVGFVMALSAFGVNVGPLVAGIGAIGFIVGFALQGTLGNFAAGIMILMHRPYDVGDVITAAGVSGKVKSMNLNTTTVTSFDNKVLVVPNGSIWGNTIENATGSTTRRVDMVFGIGYGDDIAKAQGILEGLLEAHPLVLDDPEPVVKLHELGDSSVNFICRPWTKTGDYWAVYWDITRSVKERFDAEGVSIPFPQRDVHVYQESAGRADNTRQTVG